MLRQPTLIGEMDTRRLYQSIMALHSLVPGDEVNSLFSELVSKVIHNQIDRTQLSSLEIQRLQETCSQSEFELEKYWSQRILESNNPLGMLESFPYYKNYLDLSRLELYTLKGCVHHHIQTVLFVGGGPLPMTAIVLAIHFGLCVTILDSDESAVYLSRQLIEKLDLTQKIEIQHEDGATYQNYQGSSMIFVAALAGIDTMSKNNICKQIKAQSQPGTYILARSSWGVRNLLYKPLSTTWYNFFEPIIEVRPHHDIVNSIVILKNV
jgi:nicotianamine synthase